MENIKPLKIPEMVTKNSHFPFVKITGILGLIGLVVSILIGFGGGWETFTKYIVKQHEKDQLYEKIPQIELKLKDLGKDVNTLNGKIDILIKISKDKNK